MPLLLLGVVLVALGLFSGATLVAAALGWGPAEPGRLLWIAFPGFSLAGLLMALLGGSSASLRTLASVVSYALLALSLVSAGVLILMASGWLPPLEHVGSLWFVMMVAGVLGGMGAAVLQKSAELAAQAGTSHPPA